jgi:alkyl hydroperoxide reductase subunit AhpC
MCTVWQITYSCPVEFSFIVTTEVAGADQLYKPIFDSDSDEYRGPDSSSKSEGG